VPEPEAKRSRRISPALVAVVVVAVYAILFVILNTHRAKVSFVFGTTKISVIWVILLSIGFGLVLGVLLPRLYGRRQRRR
jgi:uncharacterized integral membrane protein